MSTLTGVQCKKCRRNPASPNLKLSPECVTEAVDRAWSRRIPVDSEGQGWKVLPVAVYETELAATDGLGPGVRRRYRVLDSAQIAQLREDEAQHMNALIPVSHTERLGIPGRAGQTAEFEMIEVGKYATDKTLAEELARDDALGHFVTLAPYEETALPDWLLVENDCYHEDDRPRKSRSLIRARRAWNAAARKLNREPDALRQVLCRRGGRTAADRELAKDATIVIAMLTDHFTDTAIAGQAGADSKTIQRRRKAFVA